MHYQLPQIGITIGESSFFVFNFLSFPPSLPTIPDLKSDPTPQRSSLLYPNTCSFLSRFSLGNTVLHQEQLLIGILKSQTQH